MGAPLTDTRMAARARELALESSAAGHARLSGPSLSRVTRVLSALRRACASSAQDTSWFLENGRVIEAMAAPAPRDRLPGHGGEARIQRLARELVYRSDAYIPPERLIACAEAFDHAREMTMPEIWLLPAALRGELMSFVLRLGRDTLNRERQRQRARAFVLSGARRPLRGPVTQALCEAALSAAREREDDELLMRVGRALTRRGVRPQAAARAEYERQSLVALYLQNALTTLRALEDMDWQAAFIRISACEKLLSQDPGGTYPAMDEESRAHVRRLVSLLSREWHICESALCEAALDAAEDSSGLKGEITWWLCEDEGRRALSQRLHTPSPSRLTPDPRARRFLALTAAVWALCLCALFALGTPLFALLLSAIPLWLLCDHISLRILTRRRTGRLLRLQMDAVPPSFRTLVVIPALLTSPASARDAAGEICALSCLSRDENIDFCLLGDLPTASAPETDKDASILSAAQTALEAFNQTLSRPKCFFLTRPRALDGDGAYTARERKRGALEDLNALLTGDPSPLTGTLPQRSYRFVLTLDRGARLLPGSLHALIGAMAHPLNQKYALIQPRIDGALATTPFARLMAGEGGLDPYDAFVSDRWQALTGVGLYCGKGIYSVSRFRERLSGRILPNTVLSHDLLEGIFSVCGHFGGAAVYESFPSHPRAYLSRLHRWTRGDWQLLPYLPALPGPGARYRVISALLASLEPACLLFLLVLAFVLKSPHAAVLALLLLASRERHPARLALRLIILPAQAFCSLDAAFRAMWRMTVSHRRMLQWTTALDSERDAHGPSAAPFLLTALLLAAGLPYSLPLMAAFLSAPAILRRLSREKTPEPHTDLEPFRALAAATWRYFERAVTPLGLPVDNIQLAPATRPQTRTSPTNIGLYMASCAAAWRLGLTDAREALSRVGKAADALASLETWRGQWLNWYDAATGAALTPRYVSSVDSGNLAACLLYVSSAFRSLDTALSRRLAAMARGMDLRALFDPSRRLFYTGADADTGRPGPSHYDLLSSEARLLYYVSIMLGQIPDTAWRRLSRARGRLPGGESALLSWSGTMFEYLMPDIFLSIPPRSLLGRTRASVLRRQASPAPGAPFWGVSESGYAALDGDGQYQYRAFGLNELSLRGRDEGGVYAPYASILACEWDADGVLLNLRAMEKCGMLGEMGLYESMDHGRIVKSHMSHHQGMILLSLCNLLTSGTVRRDFLSLPEAQSVRLLLEERPARGGALPLRRDPVCPGGISGFSRCVPCATGNGGHILYGGGTTLFLTSAGSGFAMHKGVLVNRRSYSRFSGGDGFYTALRLGDTTYSLSGGEAGSRCHMDESSIRVDTAIHGLTCSLTVFVSPEDGAVCRVTEITNPTDAPVEAEVTDAFSLALSPESAYNAHPAFQNLFIRSRRRENGLVHTRVPREESESWPDLYHLCPGETAFQWETDRSLLLGRRYTMDSPALASLPLRGAQGYPIDPCSVLRVRRTVAPGGTVRIPFVILAAHSDGAPAILSRWSSPSGLIRARELARAQSLSMLRLLGLNGREYRALQRASLALMYPAPRNMGRSRPAASDASPKDLWPLGLSGELPVLLCRVGDTDDLPAARRMARAHGFYRSLGVWCDLVFLLREEGGYHHPLRDALTPLAASCGGNAPGGARILDEGRLTQSDLSLMDLIPALTMQGGEYAAGPRYEPATEPVTLVPETHINLIDPGFTPDGGYAFSSSPSAPVPAPWMNMSANEVFGLMLSERGGGFLWRGNSRAGRLTAFSNDPQSEGFHRRFTLALGEKKLSLLCGPNRLSYQPGIWTCAGEAEEMGWQVTQFVPTKGEVACADVTLIAQKDLAGEFRYDIDFLLQTHPSYAHFTRVGCWRNLLWARGGAGETAFAQMEGGVCQGPGRLRRPLNMKAGETARFYILTGCAPSETVWQDTVSRWDTDRELARLRGRKSPLSLSTPSRPLNAMLNVWLPAQTLMGRVLGRTGFYQGGGAIGFRDQLQDMLSLIGIDDARVRDHLLLCAAHQFPSGDVQHWWHPERMGVRTRVSDDKLFLPYVTAQYIRLTGDETVLDISAPYLREVPIPPDQTDWYGDPGVTDETDTLRVHCQRAIDAACRFGDHGLALMGAGDWNDGMNRVGRQGRGESVWLSQFLLVTLRNFMPYAQPSFAERYAHTAEALRAALENTWDGEWYLRAYDDDGRPLGSHARPGGCQIDSLPQTWAVFAGLSHAREAMKAVESRLIDQRHGLIRLLDPPFSHQEKAGYICAYPPGVRENGGQYTHAACWVVMAYARLGLADEAWQALQMIMPYTHAATPAQRQTYRVEPYVLAGDIYATGEYTLSDPATHAHATPTQTGSPAHQADGDEIDISQARSDGAEADTRSAPSETGASEAHIDGVETDTGNAPREPGTSQAHSDGAEAEKVGHSEPDEARMGLLGRGGWTWYTGASSWAQYVTLRELLGFEMKQGRAALHALLPSDWDEVGVTVRLPHTEYRLLCRRHAPGVSLDGKPITPPPVLSPDGKPTTPPPGISPDGKPITPPPGISSDGTPIPACSGHNHALEGSIPLIDDGGRHTAVFPPRNTEENG